MERKWNQEKALREVAETRVKALRKKLKAIENQSGDPDLREDESIGTHQTSGLHSRANSMDGIEYTDAIGASALSGLGEAIKFPGTTFNVDGTATLETIDGTSISVARTASILRPSTDGSPPRDSLGKKKLSNAQAPHGNGNSQKTSESGMVAAAKPAPRTNPARPQQQLPPNVTNIHAANETGNAPSVHSEPIVAASTQAAAPINFGPPPRPKTRLDAGTVITPNPSDFYPLRPTHQDQGGHTGFGLSPVEVVGPDLHSSTVADNHQRMGTGVGAQAMDESPDLMSFHSMGSQSQFATDARIASAAVAPHVTMPYQDYPTNVAHEAHDAFQNSSIPKQHGPTNSEHYPPPSTQHGVPAEPFSDTAAGHQVADPFDELIQQRRPTNGSQ
jgi:hypothetical protein